MAFGKTIVASAGEIVNNSGTSIATNTNPTFACVPEVENFVLKPTSHMRNPGVFTAGTVQEGTQVNITNDSNN